ncbi:MAG: hypothetical protein EPGJADBJ_03629 [Saprospiraceae bacterium]|nr:hypothetical protein [Saprospiraceae bacterium]
MQRFLLPSRIPHTSAAQAVPAPARSFLLPPSFAIAPPVRIYRISPALKAHPSISSAHPPPAYLRCFRKWLCAALPAPLLLFLPRLPGVAIVPDRTGQRVGLARQGKYVREHCPFRLLRCRLPANCFQKSAPPLSPPSRRLPVRIYHPVCLWSVWVGRPGD